MLVAGIRLPVRENLYWDTTSMKPAWGNENKTSEVAPCMRTEKMQMDFSSQRGKYDD